MENRIKSRYSDAILHQAMLRYGIPDGSIHPLDGFESFIYEYERRNETGILRIGHSLRRGRTLVQAEVDWLNYLADGGAAVARLITSDNGKMVEVVEDGEGGEFVAAAFSKAPGRTPWEVGWTPERWQSYGRLIGRVHALSKTYLLPEPGRRRPEWDDDSMQEVERNLPETEALAVQKYQELVDYLRCLPKDGESYGLVHYDPHEANLLMDDAGQLTLIDFDDCAYCWYVYDIAIVLFYSSMGQEDKQAFIDAVMPPFLRGYSQETCLASRWLAEIPYLLKQREIDLYAVIHRSFDVEDIDNPWVVRFMQGRKEKIENDVPVIDYDFERLAVYLTTGSSK